MQTRWLEAPHHYESLAVSLRAILACHGLSRPYEEIVAVLGLGMATVAVPDDELGWWCTYARDAALLEVATRYGLQLRELHPPQAAMGLARSPGYARHFQDSYLPLIRRALEHGQRVLTWRGWPPPRERLWGVLVEQAGGMLLGHTLWHRASPLPLIGPAHQAYIIEDFARPTTDWTPAQQFKTAVHATCSMWRGPWPVDGGLLTGSAAYDAWCEALAHPPARPASGRSLGWQHSQAIRVHTAARTALATWLRSIGGKLGGRDVELAARWAAACDQVVETLATCETAEDAEETFRAAGGACEVCEALRRAREIEARVIEQLDPDA